MIADTPPEPTERKIIRSQQDWEQSLGVVYFVAAGSPPAAIKIGSAVRQGVVDRLNSMQCNNHETIELLGLICVSDGPNPRKDADAVEAQHDKRFAHLQRFRPRQRGCEWFAPAPELLDYIRTSTATPESLGLPRFVKTTPTNRVATPTPNQAMQRTAPPL